MNQRSRRPGRRAYLMIAGFALLLVLFPFLFWYSTWFGRKLTDAEIDRYLNEPGKPRHAQHALVQIGERMAKRGAGEARWVPRIVELSRSPVLELRQTAAWIMGQDHGSRPFHEALLPLLGDAEPMVRRNAALSLAGFGDPAARPVLVEMLRPYTIASPAAGAVQYRLKSGEYVNPGTLVGRVGGMEVRAPVPGEVLALAARPGAAIKAGDALAELAPDKGHAWEALRALYLVGRPEDAHEIERYARGVPGMTDHVQQQARLTLQAVRSGVR